jgi:hypothetical protein
MFCDADLSPLNDDHAADDSSSDVDQVTAFTECQSRSHFCSHIFVSWKHVWKKKSRSMMVMNATVAATVAVGVRRQSEVEEIIDTHVMCRRGSRQSGGGEVLLVGLQSDEFSYVKPGLLRNWSGLQSWSYRVQSQGVKESKAKGARKKEDFILMFDDMTDAEISAALAQSKVSTTLAASDAKPTGAPFLLPDDLHFKADSLTSM